MWFPGLCDVRCKAGKSSLETVVCGRNGMREIRQGTARGDMGIVLIEDIGNMDYGIILLTAD